MKKLTTIAAFVFASATSVFAQDAVEGVWQTQADDGAFAFVTIAPCGSALCGVISQTFNSGGEYHSENIGRQLVWDMQVQKNGRYNGGQIWQPSTDKVFKSKMALAGNTLKVSGCVAGGLICKKQTWTRVQ